MMTRSILLGTTAIAAFGLAACNNSNDPGLASAAEIGQFGIVVGEPVAVISATRGQGATVDTDKFTVTFNNADGSSITIGTPEGEEITFDQDDADTWIGEDPVLGGLARLVSEDGDQLEVFIGNVTVPVEPAAQTASAESRFDPQEQLAFASGRLDEDDTREGFETYMVLGDATQSDELPRYADNVLWDQDVFYQEDVLYEEDVFDPETGELLHEKGDVQFEAGVDVEFFMGDVRIPAGTLIEGTAFYNGNFVASVYQHGEVVSDEVTGSTYVGLDFAEGTVEFNAYGGYYFDDVDDDNAGQNVTNIVEQTASFVSDVGTLTDEAIVSFDTETGEFLTGITPDTALALTGFDVNTGTFVTAVNPDFAPVLPLGVIGTTVSLFPVPVVSVIGTNFVVGVDPDTGTAVTAIVNEQTLDFVTGISTDLGDAVTAIVDVETSTFVTGVTTETDIAITSLDITTVTDGPDWLQVDLSDNGVAQDISFENGVTYTGTLDGYVEVPEPAGVGGGSGIDSVDVAGEFGGAVFGPGSSAFDVLDTDDGPFEPTQGETLGATATAGVFEANSNTNPLDDNADVEIVGAFGAESCTYCDK